MRYWTKRRAQGRRISSLSRRDTKLHNDRHVRSQKNLFAAVAAEIQNHIGALSGAEDQQIHFRRRGQKSLLTSDLMKRKAIRSDRRLRRKRKTVKAAVRTVQDAQAVFARLDFQIREDLAVHENRAAVIFRDPRCTCFSGDGIVDLSIRSKRSVENGQRDLIRAFRQIQSIFELVAYQVKPHQTG